MTTQTPDLTAIDDLIRRALAEDLGDGDVTSLATISENQPANARFVVKEDGVVSGLLIAERVLAIVDERISCSWTVADGESVRRGTTIGTVTGPARGILGGERLALNLMQRMSGISTATRAMARAAAPAKILDTRKTAPGLRLVDKWAVRLGGGQNHRHGLYDMILIKDNHIAAAGGIREAIARARQYRQRRGLDVLIEVETRTLEEVDLAVDEGGIDWILLDNMVRLHGDGFVDVSMLNEAVSRVGGRFKTEASGNVTLETVRAIAATGVDYISSGALTHSVSALDISLKIDLA